MRHCSIGHRGSRPGTLDHRTLRLEPLEPRQLLAANFLGMIDATLANYVKSLDADGSINRSDMIAIVRKVQSEADGVVDATDLSDLRTIVNNSATLKMPNYVAVLAGDIVNGNTANAHYQGAALGNLAVGNSNAKLGKLTDKWFYGADLPTTGGYAYAAASGTLYGTVAPSHLSEKQGALGDCYLIAGLGAIADSSQTAIKNMFVVNGDGTWTVRFYYNGRADYVTVNNKLPVSGSYLIFDGYGSRYSSTSNTLWLPLLEKAYAQWNETGRTARGSYTNSYTNIQGGWMGDVYQQALGYSTLYAMMTSTSSAKATMINALNGHQAVNLGTNTSPNFNDTGLYGNHAYNVLSYNASTAKFTLYNPWGSNQPKQLTWAQLSSNAGWFSATVTTQSTPAAIAIGRVSSSSIALLPPVAAISTTSTLDPIQAADAPQPAAVDAVFRDESRQSNDTAWQSTSPLEASDSWLSDRVAHTPSRSSGEVFIDIEIVFDSIQSPVAVAL
jgi:hypothetical protein